MSTRFISQPRVSFRDEGKLSNQRSSYDKGFSTQESEYEISPRNKSIGHKSGAQGEFSGNYDKQGHHLKFDGTPDMRFKENREEFEGQGFEGTTTNYQRSRSSNRGSPRNQGEFSGNFDKAGHHMKSDGTPDMRFKENREDFEGKGYEYTTSQRKESARDREDFETPSTRKIQGRTSTSKSKKGKSKSKYDTDHLKSDGTPDMRFKENRDEYSGEGFENTTTRSSSSRISKANMGLYEGNTPGEHSGKYDQSGHHLKNDGTPDMRFKENREEYSGQGYETGGKTARYLQDEGSDNFNKKIYYRRKRPPTPYAIFVREKASDMKRENPDMDMNEVFRQLGEEWRGLEQKEKDEYYKMYDEEVRHFEEQNKIPHRGPLSMRKLAQQRGLSINTDLYSSKRGKSSSGRKKFQDTEDTNEEEFDDDDENYNPTEN